MKRVTYGVALLLCAISMACSTPGSTRGQTPRKMSKSERAHSLLELASAHIIEGDGAQALAALEESRQLVDSDSQTYYLFALAYNLKKQPQLAVQSARRAIQLNPNDSRSKNTLGRLLLDLQQYSEAEPYLREAAQDLQFSESYLAKANLGILYYRKLMPQKAITYLSESISEGGDATCVAAYYRGMIFLEQQDAEKALQDFTRASRNLCSGVTEAHLAKGKALIRLKRFDQARAKMVEIQRLFPMTDASEQAQRYLREIP